MFLWSCSADTPNTQHSAATVQPSAAGANAPRATAGSTPAVLPPIVSQMPPVQAPVAPTSTPSAANGGTPAAMMSTPVTAPPVGAMPPVNPPAAPMGKPLLAAGDPWAPGPFKMAQLDMAGPMKNATVLYPTELGKDGIKQSVCGLGERSGGARSRSLPNHQQPRADPRHHRLHHAPIQSDGQ
jgi:hypothetical protein